MSSTSILSISESNVRGRASRMRSNLWGKTVTRKSYVFEFTTNKFAKNAFHESETQVEISLRSESGRDSKWHKYKYLDKRQDIYLFLIT